MKTLLGLGVISLLCLVLNPALKTGNPAPPDSHATPAQIPRTVVSVPLATSDMQARGGGRGGNSLKEVQLGTAEILEANLTLKQVVPGGAAIAYGSVSENGQRLQLGEVYVSGIGAGAVDGARAKVWLQRDGAQTYTTVMGAYKTVPSYHVVNEPAPKAVTAGSWMYRGYRNPLEQR